jgi:hypothetical protein
MRPIAEFFGSIVLITCGLPSFVGCQTAQSRSPHHAVAVAAPAVASSQPERDAAWSHRAAVVSVDPGNSAAQRRSESHFTPRTSNANVDSHTSSLLIQVAALNHLVSVHKPFIEQQLRNLGLDVTAVKQSKLRKPNSFNVLVEDVTYVEEAERKHEWEPIVYTMTPAIHVRVISANERSTFEAPPIMVRTYGPMTSQAADGYGRQLATERIDLGKRLIEWLEARLPKNAENGSAAQVEEPHTPPGSMKPALARSE